MFILQLNPMTANYESLVAVACAETVDALRALVESERVEPYTDEDGSNMCGGRLCKSFRKGGPLEYLNPPDREACIVDVGTPDDWARNAREQFNRQVLSLPFAGGGGSIPLASTFNVPGGSGNHAVQPRC